MREREKKNGVFGKIFWVKKKINKSNLLYMMLNKKFD